MYTIGTPLPSGKTLSERLEKWIEISKNNFDNIQPVGHMKLETIPDMLRYAFMEEGLTESAYTNVIKALETHNYCKTLKNNNEIDNCDAAKSRNKPTLRKESGYPVK